MKRIISIASVAVALLCLTSCAAYGKCGRGNSDGMEKSYSIKGFTGIKSELCTGPGFRNSSRWNAAEVTVYVEKSTGYDVSVRISDERYSDAVRLEKSGSNLIVKVMALKPLDKRDSAPEVDVFVKMPQIGFIDLSGVVSMNMKGEFSSDELEVHLSGASTLCGLVSRNTCSKVEMSGASSASGLDISSKERCSMKISEAGEISGLKLRTGFLDLDYSGAADVSGADISADNVDIDASGAAKMRGSITSCSSAVLALSGGADFSLCGEADSMDAELSGAAKLSMDSGSCGTSLRLGCSEASSARMENAAFREVDVSLYSIASARVRATESLVTDVAKTASLDYYGSPGSVYHRSSNIREHK